MPHVLEMLAQAETLLSHHHIDSPRLSAQILLAKVLGISRLDLMLEPRRCLAADQHQMFTALLARRAQGEPVAYLVGGKEFYGLDFYVDNRVLIPRPETEEMVEAVLQEINGNARIEHTRCGHGHQPGGLRFADVGTGSGVLAVTLAHYCPQATGFAMDIESGALEVARYNACRHGVIPRLLMVQGDCLASLPQACLDLVITNPPYVTEEEYKELSHEVAGYEPRRALVGGADGLNCLRTIEGQARKVLKPGGILWAEIGWLQGRQVDELFARWKQWCIHRDLGGRDRFVRAVL